jgi:parallel beta-helix repeat protein
VSFLLPGLAVVLVLGAATPGRTSEPSVTPTPTPTFAPEPDPTPVESPTASPLATPAPSPTPPVDPLCGTILTGELKLSRDVLRCPAFGIKLDSDAVLDCDGHEITGVPGSSSGMWILQATRAEVRNCRVSGFVRGLRIVGGASNRAIGNELFENSSYGIELTGSTSGNWIEGNLVRDNGDEGIHLAANTTDNDIVGNHILRSVRENLYFIKNHGNRASGNTLGGSGAAAIFIKHSSENVLTANTLLSGRVQVRGESVANRFADNGLTGQGFLFEAFDDPILGWTFPHGNLVEGGAIAKATTCFTFNGAFDNHASGVVVDRCLPVSSSTVGGQEPVDNTADLCGDGLVSGGEECDRAALNGLATSCCTSSCRLRPPEAICRPAVGECDLAETCEGATGACPDDGFAALGVACTEDANPCTLDRCDGQNRCGHPAGNPGAVCRPAADACDVADTCSGSSRSCPADRFRPASVVCRAAVDACDVAESCTGSSASCPVDTFVPAGTVCREPTGPCDVAEACTGSSPTCPVDRFGTAGVTCRAEAGPCDVPEACTGSSPLCPSDRFRPASTICRPSDGQCDAAERCRGSGPDCPADAHLPNGRPCNDGNACTRTDTCSEGECLGKNAVTCRALDECHVIGACDPATGACSNPDRPNGAGCGGGSACSSGQRCIAGQCTTGAPVECGLCEVCDAGEGCIERPRPQCAAPRSSASSTILLVDRSDDTHDRLAWVWRSGGPLVAGEFGDPTTTTSFALCLYDREGGQPNLVFRADAPATPGCAERTCWASTDAGYSYRGPSDGSSGATRVELRATTGTLKFLARGTGLPSFSLPRTAPLTAQMQSSAGGCWGANYAAPRRNSAKKLRAKSD